MRCSSVTYIGHVIADKGLMSDPEKTKAIVNMLTPTNVKSLQEFLGMAQYLSKVSTSALNYYRTAEEVRV